MGKLADHGVASWLEAMVATEVKKLVAGLPAGAEITVEPSASLCRSLEFFIPQLLSSSHSEWKGESLDGVFVACARKTGPAAVHLVGTCVLMSDQTMTPFMVELEASLSSESIASFRVHLGEPGRGQLGISGPKWNSHGADTLLAMLTTRLDRIAWSYTIVSDAN